MKIPDQILEAIKVERAENLATLKRLQDDGLVVHDCSWAGQGDIQIRCTLEWTEPSWGPASGETEYVRVFRADNQMYYTFTDELVTCPDCVKVEKPNDV